ncbi:MAG: glycine cleavage system aminomethyltransferase GcvT [Actinomycetota bacterium]
MRSPLHAFHEAHGARFVDFGGWEMPVQYQSVLAEHKAVREAVGWFDVSHLGRFSWTGPEARSTLRQLLANDVDLIEPGRTQYTLLLNEQGGIEDDLLIWWWDDQHFWVLPNAGTHDAVLARFRQASPTTDATDLREQTVMLAVQGPDGPRLLESMLGFAPKRFRTGRAEVDGRPVWLAGTGYTGERGGEVVTDRETAVALVERLGAEGALPCGLGARDTLRLEAGLLLAGQDFDSTRNPLEAGLESAVAWDHEFVGRAALEKIRSEGVARRLIAFTMPGRKIPRHGYPLRAGQAAGLVTSGNFSPMLQCGIGLGYLAPPAADDSLEVGIRGQWEPAARVELPFYRR